MNTCCLPCQLANEVNDCGNDAQFLDVTLSKSLRSRAREWHQRCVNWNRHDLNGCNCKHIVGDYR